MLSLALENITPKSALEERLAELATYKYSLKVIETGTHSVQYFIGRLDSVENILLYPNFKIINELNTSFIALMNIDYGYSSRRLVPISIIRNLIDIAAFLYAYTIYPDKKVYLNRYKKGRDINQFDIDGKPLKYGTLIRELSKRYEGLYDMYQFCCNYVHSSYHSNKASSAFDYPIDLGRKGFLGKQYGLKEEDFTEWLIEGIIDTTVFDYAEECDIVDACIRVNKILTTLIDEIRSSVAEDYKDTTNP